MHAEYTVRAARAGKHVLCEKPMSNTAAEAQEMVDACRKANRKLMIAYRCQYEPTHLHAIELMRSTKLGKIVSIESANGFNIRPGEWRITRKLGGGGPLMDMGIYSLNACRYLTGEEPTGELKAYSSVTDQDGRFSEVEENLSWTMKFPSGIVANCTTTYGASMPGTFAVYGSKGTMRMDAAFGYQGPAPDRQNPGRGPYRRPERRARSRALSAPSRSPGRMRSEQHRAEDLRRGRTARHEADRGDLPLLRAGLEMPLLHANQDTMRRGCAAARGQ
jgi:predicted dehydrogenase